MHQASKDVQKLHEDRKVDKYELMHKLEQDPSMLLSQRYLEQIDVLGTEKIKKGDETIPDKKDKKIGGRTLSLPKVSSRVKLSQLEVLDKQGATSRAALTFKHLSNMDH